MASEKEVLDLLVKEIGGKTAEEAISIMGPILKDIEGKPPEEAINIAMSKLRV